MKVLLQPCIDFPVKHLKFLPNDRELELICLPRVGERIWLADVLWQVTSIHHNSPGIVIYITYSTKRS